ncbi:MAG: SDR family oxidoreductase [Eubacteriales bacterium]|jgi:short-subunit dehydrogenase
MKEKGTALVTGASSGIGCAISEMLLEEGYEVWGIGRDFSKSGENGLSDSRFSGLHRVTLDLLDTEALEDFLKQFMRQHRHDLKVLVNGAGCAWYGLHETLRPEMITAMVRTDLEVPMLTVNLLLPAIRENQGHIINICSVTSVERAPHGAAYGAVKAGLYAFSGSILEENRKYGVKVTAILPDMTDTALYRHADFQADPEEGCSLSPADVAETVRSVLRKDFIVDTVMLRPQYHRIMKKRR